MHSISRRTLLASAALLAAPAVLAQGESYPQRPLRLVVAYPPGSSADTLARLVGQELAAVLGQSVVVENRAGAAGQIGTDFVAKQPADGYTLIVGNDATHATNQLVLKSALGSDPLRNFAPVTQLASNAIVVVAHPSLGVNSFQALLAHARAHPDQVSFGTPGSGSAHHLAGELINQMAGVNMLHVPYRGTAAAVTDVVGGQIPLSIASLSAVLPHIRSGRVIALGGTDRKRIAALPQVPAIAEVLPGFEVRSWHGVFAPAGTPAAIVDRLAREITAIVRRPDVQAKLQEMGLEVVGSTPQAFTEMIRADIRVREDIVRRARIQPE